ncbi:MAG TPA: MYXO-CTERM sorting domain-containing protein [Phycisphaerales bacterium]|nr:MYXO-CTERM sorting domain-containing protein [Phycisphaerales bacterium]
MKNIAAVLVLAAAGSAANAQVWAEIPDAGDLVATSQSTVGVGGLNGITGLFGSGTDVDMFCIHVDDWATFSARVTSLGGGGALDTQVYLFDAAGNGIAFNDDAPFPVSILPAGHALYSGRTNGEMVYIAVSQYNVDPQNGAGAFMFPNTFTGVFGPTNPGPVASWAGTGGTAGTYTIELTGSSYCVPTPGAAAMLGLGGLAAFRRRR